jgi:hypothetical protein
MHAILFQEIAKQAIILSAKANHPIKSPSMQDDGNSIVKDRPATANVFLIHCFADRRCGFQARY